MCSPTKRAYANALIYKIQTDDSKSGKESKSKDLASYKKGPFTVKYPDGRQKRLRLRRTGRDL